MHQRLFQLLRTYTSRTHVVRELPGAAVAATAFVLIAAQTDHVLALESGVVSKAATQQINYRATDVSAAQRKHKTSYAAPAASTPPKSTWTGPDPTKGPGIERLHELQRQGACVIDEGYGRYTFCSNM